MGKQLIKHYLLFFTTFILISCNSQTSETKKEIENGIIYFSYDNGMNWKNSSKGLPENARIGLGGIATSIQNIGVAIKDSGVYLYHLADQYWSSIPTKSQILKANIGAMAIFENSIFVGTQFSGIFITNDKGKNWTLVNNGLSNLTIRRFCEFNNKLYVCTNDGFYVYNKKTKNWKREFGQNGLQTNGATVFNGIFYLATNKGIYMQQADKSWINSSPQFSMHNISADKTQLYAMTYNELLMSSVDGTTWQTQQNGLPKELYTFNILTNNNVSLAGQWDGIYKKTNNNTFWELSSNGLPKKFAVTNLKKFKDLLIIGTSERKLKDGASIDKQYFR